MRKRQSLIYVLRFLVIVPFVLVVATFAWWLNLPRGFGLMAQGLGQERHPAEFDVAFVGMRPGIAELPVQLFYMPITPILGITAHYWSIIAPLRIDAVTHTLQVPVQGGRMRFAAPLGLAGPSNFRLRTVLIGEPGAPYALDAGVVSDSSIDPSVPPASLDIPLIAVTGGEYRFDGALALWRRTQNREANPYGFSPRDDSPAPPQLIWDGLRAVTARVDLTPYAIASFEVPSDWAGDGWKNEGYQLSRPHATLTNKVLNLPHGVSVPLPFARECASSPQFTVVAGDRIPQWSRIDGLWRPMPRRVWEELLRSPSAPGVDVRFAALTSGRPSLDRVESFTVLARTRGKYRLFAACPNPHYDSVGVTWIDIVV
jgi:hypothetical protein